MKNIRETLVFNMLNNGNRIDSAVSDIVKNGQTITKEQMASAFYVIEKNFRYIMKNKVLEAIKDGTIIMKLNHDGLTTPSCMPWFLISSGNRVRVVVVLDSVVSKYNKEENICEVSNVKQLYCLLESGYIALLCHTNPGINTKNTIVSEGSAIYAEMFVKILNKEYALNVDRSRVNLITFLASKFYLINILGLPNSARVNEYAYKNCVAPNKMMISTIDMDFGPEDYSDIGSFIQAIANHPDMEGYLPKLSVRSFMHQYTMLFGPACLFAIESLPYFLFNIISVSMNAYLNKQKVLEPIVEKRSNKIYLSLSNL